MKMSDYLEALRHDANCLGTDTHESKLLHEAADRIEELEAQVDLVNCFDEDPPNINLNIYSEDYKDGWYDCIQHLKAAIKGDEDE